jgi:hypothetical protein
MTPASPVPATPHAVPRDGAPVDGERLSHLTLRLEVSDPEVVAELRRFPEGETRDRQALAALRLGILALRAASGEVDATSIKQAGDRLVAQVREALTAHAADLRGSVSSTLQQYFDPSTGVVPQRIQSLVKKDGELEAVLKRHLGPEESVLASTLAAKLGRDSDVFKMLDPAAANGLKNQLARAMEEALRAQRDQVLQQFSLDREDSALARLVKRVEAAQKSITDEFSTDNEKSALNRLSQLLENTSKEISARLTLDDDASALALLKRALEQPIGDLVKKSEAFHAEVRETLSALKARRAEADRSTQHGVTFEEALGTFLAREAQRQGDVHQAVGATTGAIKFDKTGDHVVELGRESAAPGVRVVFEAKEDQSYGLKDALTELDRARKNRSAQLGVFVFSKRTAPADLLPLQRHGADLVACWDAEDPATDVNVWAAYSLARALAVRQRDASQDTRAAHEIEMAARAIERQLAHLDEIRTWAGTVRTHGEKIEKNAGKIREEVQAQVAVLDRQATTLKQAEPEA